MEQVAVGRVNLNEVKACGDGALRGGGKCGDNVGDSRLIERLRDGIVGSKGKGAGRDRLPAALVGKQQALPGEGRRHAAFTAGVRELDACMDSLRVKETDDLLELGNVRVFPDAQIAAGDAALGRDCGGLKNDESGATLSATAEMDEMPVGGKSVLR